MNETLIHEFCNHYYIFNYTINDDLSVDVDGNVDLSGKYLQQIPIKFNKVKGSFNCSACGLTSLINCPTEIHGDFDCSDNFLENLDGAPVLREFHNEDLHMTQYPVFNCSNNKIKTLKSFKLDVVTHFNCSYNPNIKDLSFSQESKIFSINFKGTSVFRLTDTLESIDFKVLIKESSTHLQYLLNLICPNLNDIDTDWLEEFNSYNVISKKHAEPTIIFHNLNDYIEEKGIRSPFQSADELITQLPANLYNVI